MQVFNFFYKELENAVEGWTDDLAHLTLLKETLSVYISADDISILNERIELLHRQWEELCHQVNSFKSVLQIKVMQGHLNMKRNCWNRRVLTRSWDSLKTEVY